MKSLRRIGMGVAGLSLALAGGGGTLWLAAPGSAVMSLDAKPPNQQQYGGGLLIESQVDSNLVKSQRVVYEVVRCNDFRVNLFSAW